MGLKTLHGCDDFMMSDPGDEAMSTDKDDIILETTAVDLRRKLKCGDESRPRGTQDRCCFLYQEISVPY